MSKPYKEVNPGDPILAVDWNTIQADIRQHILTHVHTGSGESGAKLDITALAFGADLGVRKLSAAESLTVGSSSQPLLSVNPAAPNQEGSYQVNVAGTLRADQVRTGRLDGITSLAVGTLAVTGNVGIGVTAEPSARLEVNGDGKFTGAVIAPKLIGDVASETLDIIGAGTAETNRKLTLWAEGGATIQGGLTVSGATTVNGSLSLGGDLSAGGKPLTIASAAILTGNLILSDNRVPVWQAKLEVALPATDNTTKALVIGKGATNYLTILNTGNVGIGTASPTSKLDIMPVARTGNHPAAVKGLYVTGDFGAASDGVEFRHSNATQGIGFGFNTIYAAGTNTNQDLNLLPKGTGTVAIAPSSSLSFGAQVRQMINLWGTGYGIGVQSGTQYFRTGKNFAWYKDGTHNDVELNAGANGTLQMVIKDGNVGIGTSSPGATLSFKNTDSSDTADGITWFNPTPTAYGIHRTAGAWATPNFQQLRLGWQTGIILDPGTAYAKSYVDIQGNGLRVTAGNVGIGTTSPGTYKLNVQGGNAFFSDHLDIGNFQAADRFLTLKVGGGNKYRSGVRFWAWQENFGYSIEYDERDTGLHFKNYNVSADGSSLMVIKGGNVGIGTINPDRKLHIKQPRAGNGIRLEETDANGAVTGRHLNIYYEGQGTVVFYHQNGAGQYMTQNGNWNLNSDRSLKQNIVPLQGILDKVMRLKPVHFQWRSSKLDNLGFIAQEVEPIFPELVSSVTIAEKNVKGLPYATFGVLAIAALQELAVTLEQRINDLSAQVTALTNPK